MASRMPHGEQFFPLDCKQLTVSSTAVTLETATGGWTTGLPELYRYAWVQAEDGDVRLSDSVTPVAGGPGMLLAEGSDTWIDIQDLATLQLIAEGADVKVNVSIYARGG